MKKELTVEQSQRLIDLGVPKVKASKVAWETTRDVKGNLIPKKEQRRGVMDKPFAMMHVGMQDFSNHDIFTLTDLLEILPKVMHKEKQAYHYNLVMYWAEDEKKWRVTYDAIGDNMGSETATELIDALYELTVWCLKERKLKI